MNILETILTGEMLIHEPSLAQIIARMTPLFRQLSMHADDPAALKVRQDSALSIADFVNQRRATSVDAEGFSTIHANDFLARGMTNVDRMLGATDYNDLIADVNAAAADPNVRGILLDINSPGGSVVGVPEAAAAVRSARGSKPVVAYIETLGASAAYYFAAASHAIVASPSAIVGSIGTIATFVDLSGLLASVGVKVEHMTGGDLKASGTPFRSMTRSEREFLQGRIDEMTNAFHSWVSSHRPEVAEDSMRGQWFSGAQALTHGLVDQTGQRADAMNALRALVDMK